MKFIWPRATFSGNCSPTQNSEQRVSARVDQVFKRILFSLSMMTAPAVAGGEECGEIGRLAGLVMEFRQMGAEISSAMEIADRQGFLRDLNRRFVTLAYEIPAYPTEIAKKTAIKSFSDDMQLECYKAAQ